MLLTAGCVTLVALIAAAANTVSRELGQAAGRVPRTDAVAGRMHHAAADGRFQFAVTGIRCGVRQVGTRQLGQKARGQYCLVAVTVKNLGRHARTLDGARQTGYARDGRAYPSESGAAMFVGGSGPTVLERLDPGAQVRGTLVFDIPRDTTLVAVVLRGSVRTPGVRVPLT